jgi:hypothetical protein
MPRTSTLRSFQMNLHLILADLSGETVRVQDKYFTFDCVIVITQIVVGAGGLTYSARNESTQLHFDAEDIFSITFERTKGDECIATIRLSR